MLVRIGSLCKAHNSTGFSHALGRFKASARGILLCICAGAIVERDWGVMKRIWSLDRLAFLPKWCKVTCKVTVSLADIGSDPVNRHSMASLPLLK
jgi:hypothetical protein